MNLKERTYLWYLAVLRIDSGCYLLSRGGATLAQQQTFIIVLAISVLSSPGRTLGLDGLLFASRKGSRA